MRRKNLHLIDDALIVIGWIFFVLASLVLLGAGVEGDTGGIGAGLFLGVVSAAMLVPGYRLRKKENRVIAVWRILESALEVHVPELMRATGFPRDEIEDAVRVLNGRGLAYYVHDATRDVLLDGRLRTSVVHVDQCPNCGATIHADVALDLSRPPVCRYCQHAVGTEHVARLKRQLMDDLRAAPAPPVPAVPGIQFSVPLFVCLVLCFWPAALVYALRCFSPAMSQQRT
jgi:hypothetical protein